MRKSGTEFAQMPHTGWFNVLDFRINGISVGEFDQMSLCGASLGVRSIFGAGDEAFTREASELIKGIETVSVKRGIMPGSGEQYSTDAYKERYNGAIHMHPDLACEQIRAGAERALRRFVENREQFELLKLQPPFRLEVKYRSDDKREAHTKHFEHPESVIELLNSSL